MTNEHRVEAWLDTLPEDERTRARYIASLPPSMAAAHADHDLRTEMRADFAAVKAEFKALRTDIKLANRPVSKRSVAMLSILGGALVDGVLQAVHHIK